MRVQSICAKGAGRARTMLGQELGLFLHKHHREDGNSDLELRLKHLREWSNGAALGVRIKWAWRSLPTQTITLFHGLLRWADSDRIRGEGFK